MLSNRTKSYGVHDDITVMSSYNDDEGTKSQAIFDMLNALQESISENRRVITNRGKLMYLATWFSLSSIVLIFISFLIKQINL